MAEKITPIKAVMRTLDKLQDKIKIEVNSSRDILAKTNDEEYRKKEYARYNAFCEARRMIIHQEEQDILSYVQYKNEQERS